MKSVQTHKADRVHSENRHTHFEQNPLISIVIPLYCTPTPYLKELIDSVRHRVTQTAALSGRRIRIRK